tara:strand:+ start:1117 stop:1989 length:873 start_codon:yes stop_codon:yes gene_type:complete
MKSKTIFIILFAILGFTISCSSFETPKIISVGDVQITKEDSESLFIDSKINVYNPNSFSISTKDVSFNLYLDSVYIGKGEVNNELVLGKKTNSNVNSSLIIKKSNLKSFLSLKDSITLKILGSTNISYIPKKFYFDFDYKIYPKDFIALFTDHLMDDIKIQIKNVKIKKLNLKNIFLELTFILENKSLMECNVKTLDIKLFKSNLYQEIIGRSEINENFKVRSNSINQFESQLKANILSMGSALFSNTIGNRNSFFIEVNSIVEYNNMEFPFTIKNRIDYNPRTLEIKLK